jgi:hypothetical protein
MTTKLIISPHKPSSKATFEFDWESIEDANHRETAKVLVGSLKNSYEKSIKEVEGVARRYTNNLSQTVRSLKRQLPHGLFRDICRQALNLNDHQIGAYAEVGRYIEQGALFGQALEMVNRMEPRAASKFLKADEETKGGYVAMFEETGRVPSQRDFTATSKASEPPINASNHLPQTTSVEEAKKRILENKIHLAHACGAIAELLSQQPSASETTKGILRSLKMQINYFLND